MLQLEIHIRNSINNTMIHKECNSGRVECRKEWRNAMEEIVNSLEQQNSQLPHPKSAVAALEKLWMKNADVLFLDRE